MAFDDSMAAYIYERALELISGCLVDLRDDHKHGNVQRNCGRHMALRDGRRKRRKREEEGGKRKEG